MQKKLSQSAKCCWRNAWQEIKYLNAKDPTNAGGNKNAEEGDKVNKIGTKKRQRKQK